MSSGGTSIRFDEALQIAPETRLRLAFPAPAAGAEVPATVVSSEGSVQRVRFENLSIAEEEVLTMVLYSRADSWLGWGESRKSDNVHVTAWASVFLISMHGLGVDIQEPLHKRKWRWRRKRPRIRFALDRPHLVALTCWPASSSSVRTTLHGQTQPGQACCR